MDSFQRGFLFWLYPKAAYFPPISDFERRDWLEGFLQSHADNPSDPREWVESGLGEGVHSALKRTLSESGYVSEISDILVLLDSLITDVNRSGEFLCMRL